MVPSRAPRSWFSVLDSPEARGTGEGASESKRQGCLLGIPKGILVADGDGVEEGTEQKHLAHGSQH
jgi:hypothetical protein